MLRRYGVFTLFAVAGFAALVALLSGSGQVTARVVEIVLPAAAVTAAFVAFSIFAAILVHEAGHVLAGLAVGFRFLTMRVGPLELRRQSDGLRLAVVANPHLSGFARLIPRSPDRLVARMMAVIVGGPAASLAYSLLTFLVLRALPQPSRGGALLGAVPHFAALSLFVMGLSVLPGTLLPFTSVLGSPSDMKVILTLLGRGPARERLVALMLVGRELQDAVRARDWDPMLVETAVRLRDGATEELRGRLLAYYYYYDRGDIRGAQEHLARAVQVAESLGKKAGVMLDGALLESAFFWAWQLSDLPSATAFRAKVKNVPEAAQGVVSLADAAIALCSGDTVRAVELLNLAHKAMVDSVARYGGAVDFELDRISDLRRACEVRE